MTDGADVGRKIISGLAWEFSTKMIIQIASWASTFLVARLLAPGDYGIVAVSGVFTGFFALISNMGLSAGIVNSKDVSKSEKDAIFWVGLFISLTAYGALYFAAPFIASFYPDMAILKDVIRVAGLMMVFSSLNIVPYAMVLRSLNFRFAALVELLVQFVTVATTLLMAFNGYGPWSLILPVVLGQLVSSSIYAFKHDSWPGFDFNLRKVSPVLFYGTTLISSRMLQFAQQQLGTFISAAHLSKESVGYYFYASQLANIPLNKLGSVFEKIAFPSISSSRRQGGNPGNIFLSMHLSLILFSFPALTGMALIAEDLTSVLLTDKWLPMVPVFRAFCIINLLQISATLMPTTLESVGAATAALRFQILSTAVLPLAMLFGVSYGLEGMVYAWCAAYPFLYIFITYLLLTKLDIKLTVFLNSCWPVICASVLMAAAVLFVQHVLVKDAAQLPRLVALVTVGAITYISSIRFLFPSRWADFKKVVGLLRNKGQNQPGM